MADEKIKFLYGTDATKLPTYSSDTVGQVYFQYDTSDKADSTNWQGKLIFDSPGGRLVMSTHAYKADKLYSSRNLKIGGTTRTDDGSQSLTWTYADIGASVSNKWTAGTTSGPQLTTTVNSINATAATIPSASASASGVITTGAQTFAGRKTFNGGVTVANGNNLSFNSAASTIDWDDATYRQRIKVTDDSTANTAVFTFQQSTDSGANYIDLMTIKDNGIVVANTFSGSLSGNATSANKATKDGDDNVISSTYLKKRGMIESSVSSVTTGTNAGTQSALRIYGQTYGNDSTYIKTSGKLSYGDPGPQIQFSTSASGGQQGAIIFTDHDTIGTGVSWNFVTDQSDGYLIAPHIKALSGFVGNLTGNADTATKANTWTTSRKISISSTAGTTGTNVNGSADATLIVPSTMTGFSSITSTSFTGKLVGNADSATSAGKVNNKLTVDAQEYDGSAAVSVGNTINYLTVTGTAASSSNGTYNPAKWTANTTLSLRDGLIVCIKMPTAGHDYGCTLSIDNGTTYKPISQTSQSNGSRLTTHYPNGATLVLIYSSTWVTNSIFMPGSTARSNVTGSWVVINGYNTDSGINTYLDYAGETTGTTGLWANSILMRTSDNKWSSVVTSSSNGTSKTKSTEGFMIGSKIWWTNYTVAANTGLQSSWRSIYSFVRRIDFRYSSNCGTTLTAGKPVYLVGTISNGKFYLADTWWTQTIPTTDDSKIYVLVGGAYSTYQVDVYEDNEWFRLVDGQLTSYSFVSNRALQDGSGNTITSTYSQLGHTHTATTAAPSATTSVLTSVKSAGATPTLGTEIAADDITNWSAGSLPTLGTAIAADDITAWSAGSGSFSYTCTTTTITSAGALSLSHSHTAPSLSYTARSIPNVTAVGTLPSLSYTARSIPNVTAVGSMPTFNSGNVASSAHTHTLTTSGPSK